MIIRGIPKDLENYIKVTSLVSNVLVAAGFTPKYMSEDGYLYYFKGTRLEVFMREEGLQCEM